MEQAVLYAECILPLPLPGYYTYKVPDELRFDVAAGKRVEVEFGQRKLYSALIRRLTTEKPAFSSVKSIRQVLDVMPLVSEEHLRFWEWMADYYMCTMGELMLTALPPGLKLSSESLVCINPAFSGDISQLNKTELSIVENLLSRNQLSIADISKLTSLADAMRPVKNLVEKKVLVLREELEERFTPKMETWLAPGADISDELSLQHVIDGLEKRAPRQLEVMMRFVQLSLINNQGEAVLKSDVLKTLPETAYTALSQIVKKGYVREIQREVSRLANFEKTHEPSSILFSPAQEKALEELDACLKQKQIALLHGLTGSGKTEIYIRQIETILKEGKQALFLLPEIALTSQIVNRLRKYFGRRVGVYHSKYNEQERIEIWKRVLLFDQEEENGYSIIIGPRSALFLPYSRLGLIIVDEEHDGSYKQQTPAPRYHARDAAIYLANMMNARVVLGSATPSFESYFNALKGKYGLVKLTERFGHSVLPEIVVADLAEAAKHKEMKSHYSRMLVNEIIKAKEMGQQSILFQNRRGFAAKLQCAQCSHSPGCEHCDVTLTYHKEGANLRCHYCGYSIPVPVACPQCDSTKLFFMGFGTQKVETELPEIIPGLRMLRMDLDTTRGKQAHQRILNDFQDGKADVLIGTQMVTKGLDFDKVALVGILNADAMITFPDFRSFERSYQLIAQVSGRAGRKSRKGKVVIQTRMPHHPVIRCAIDNDFDGLYNLEMADRERFSYPPFVRLIQITIQHSERERVDAAALWLVAGLRQHFGKRVLGPEYPPVSRIRNQFLKNILIKLERKLDLKQSKQLIATTLRHFESVAQYKKVRVLVDVDPV